MTQNGLREVILELTSMPFSKIELLMSHFKTAKLNKGEYILRTGQICSRLFFVENGCLRTFYNKEEKEINTAFTFKDNFTTNVESLKSHQVSEYNISAYTNATLLYIENDDLTRLYAQHPEIELFGKKVLLLLLKSLSDHSNLLSLYSPKERYSYLLNNRPEIIQSISLSQLSSYLGIARETLSRIRGRI